MTDSKPWRFQFKLLNTLIMLALVCTSLYLAYWQSGRIAEKTELEKKHHDMLSAAPMNLNTMDKEQLLLLGKHPWQPVTVTGTFLNQHAFFLDSQVYKGKAGYHYLVPLSFNDGRYTILVNLGWVSAGKDRNKLPEFPAIDVSQPITGQLSSPRAAMPGFEQNKQSKLQLFVNFKALSDRIGAAETGTITIIPMVLLLDEEAQGGLPREWPSFDAKISMHEFYVAHWLVVALIIVFLYFYFAYRKPQA